MEVDNRKLDAPINGEWTVNEVNSGFPAGRIYQQQLAALRLLILDAKKYKNGSRNLRKNWMKLS